MTIHDRLRSHLQAERAALPATPSELTEGAVVSRARRSTRRRRAAVGVGAVLGLAAASVGGWAVLSDDGEQIVSVATGGPEGTDGGPSAQASADAPAGTAAPAPIPPPVADGGWFAYAPNTGMVPVFGAAWVVPWDGGLLHVGFEPGTQPVPELSQEVKDLFPPEVAELFPEGRPASIEEAIEVLNEHPEIGQEVNRILAEHPEARDAIYAAGPGPGSLVFATSTDGLDWQEAGRLEAPAGMQWVQDLTVADGRLVVLAMGTGGPVLGATDGLSGWTLTETLTAPPSDVAVPPGTAAELMVDSVAVSGERVVVLGGRHTYFDPWALVADRLPDISDRGVGIGTDSDGIVVTIQSGDGRIEDELHFTWDELGVSPEQADLAVGSVPEAITWTGTLAGGLTAAVGDGPAGQHVLATSAGFLRLGPGPRGFAAAASADGVSWNPVAAPADLYELLAASPVADGVAVLARGTDGIVAYHVSPDGAAWEPADVSALADLATSQGAWPMQDTTGPAGVAVVLQRFLDEPLAPTGPPPLDIELDGYVLTMTFDGSPIVLRSSADGTVVATYPTDTAAPGFEFDDSGTLTLSHPETGDVLVTVDAEMLQELTTAHFEEFVPREVVEPPTEMEFAVVFSADGRRWDVLARRTVTMDQNGPGGASAVVLADSVVIRIGDEATVYQLGSDPS